MNRHKSGAQKRKDKREREKITEDLRKKNVLVTFFEKRRKTDEAAPATSTSSSIDVHDSTIECESDANTTDELRCLGSTETKTSESETWQSNSKNRNSPDDHTTDPCQSTSDFAMDSEKIFNPKDPSAWPRYVTDHDKQLIVKYGLNTGTKLTEMATSLPKDVEDHVFPVYLLHKNAPNGREKLARDWLMASGETNALFCGPCRLFSSDSQTKHKASYLITEEGFNPNISPWRKLYRKLPEHENSHQHKNCYLQWRALERVVKGDGLGIDNELQKQLRTERDKMICLLKRLLDVTIHLGSRGLPFRGSSEKIGDVHNGNFLGCLELISHYDTLLEEHLKTVKKSQDDGAKRLQAHYLSHETQNEFIDLCGKRVLEVILDERMKAIYFSLICDATPDVAHIEQNVLILRYVFKEEKTRQWIVKERFLEFFDFCQKTGLEIADEVLCRLQYHGINIADCRGQSYDNGSNMSGKHKGVQARIQEKHPTAIYSPCAAHSLNLVGVHAASCCPDAMTFFGCINRLYILFSGSPDRWSILTKKTGCSLHRQSDTRWSAKKEAVRPIARHLPSVIEALEELIETRRQKLTAEAYSEAVGLRKYFSSFKAVLMAVLWVKVLESFDERNLILQSRAITMEIAAANIKNLTDEMQSLREEWPTLLSEAKLVAQSVGIAEEFPSERRQGNRITRGHQIECSEDMNPETKFKRNVFLIIMDSLITELKHRFQHMDHICSVFSPILSFNNMNTDDIREKCKILIQTYSEDLTPSLESEIIHLRNIHQATFNKITDPLGLLNAIYLLQLENIFPEVSIALRIFCSLPITVAEGERAFSKLALIKNYMRGTMRQERLNGLALLSIEHETARKIDFSDVIKDFASLKVRRLI